MKKFTKILALVLLAVFAFGGNADAVQRRYEAQVFKIDQNKGTVQSQLTGANQRTTGITYRVFAVGTFTSETLLATIGPTGTAVTSKTNPVTTTVFGTDGGKISFVCDPTDATSDLYVDLLVVDTVGGYTAFVKNFSPYNRTVVIDETRDKMHKGTIWFTPTTTAETSTGITFGQNTFIHDVWVQVITAVASTVDIGLLSSGTTGDADGFRKGVLLSTTGFVKDTGVVTNGTTIDYTAASTYGALLYTAITGSDAVATGGGRSYLGHVIENTQTGVLTFTSYVSTERGLIHYWFTPTE